MPQKRGKISVDFHAAHGKIESNKIERRLVAV